MHKSIFGVFLLLLSCQPKSETSQDNTNVNKWTYDASVEIVMDSLGDPSSLRLKRAFVTIEGDTNSWTLIDPDHRSNRVDGLCSLYEGTATKVEVKCVDMKGQIETLFLHSGTVTTKAHVSQGRVLAEGHPMDILYLELLPFSLESGLGSADLRCTLGRYKLGMLSDESLPEHIGNDLLNLTDVSLNIDGSQYFYGIATHAILRIPNN